MRAFPVTRITHRSVTALLGLLMVTGCASLPPAALQPKSPSQAFDPAAPSALHQAFAPQVAAHPGRSGFRLIPTGIDALTARIELIDAAQHALDLQYYIFRGDESGNLVVLALLRAAERGVRIRVLVDDGETVPGDERILSLAAQPGIEVRIFNPLTYRGHNKAIRGTEFLFGKGRLDYRMHNKLIVADNALAIIGGRNIGNQYFQIDPTSQFGDDDVVVAGPLVARLSGVFDQFWNGELAVPAPAIDPRDTSAPAFAAYLAELDRYRETLHGSSVARPSAELTPVPRTPIADIVSGRNPLLWATSQLVYDSPDKKQVADGNEPGRVIYKAVLERAKTVKTEFLLVTPYFIPSPDELAILEADRDRQTRVAALTNSLPAAPVLAAHSGYVHYRRRLLEHGVALYEERALPGGSRGTGQSRAMSRYGHYALHAKLYVFDRASLFIGSMNYDQRSKHLNTEIGVLIDSPELAHDVANRFDELTQLDNAYVLSLEPTEGTRGKTHLVWTTREAGTVVHLTTEPARSAWQRFKVRLLALLPLDDEL